MKKLYGIVFIFAGMSMHMHSSFFHGRGGACAAINAYLVRAHSERKQRCEDNAALMLRRADAQRIINATHRTDEKRRAEDEVSSSEGAIIQHKVFHPQRWMMIPKGLINDTIFPHQGIMPVDQWIRNCDWGYYFACQKHHRAKRDARHNPPIFESHYDPHAMILGGIALSAHGHNQNLKPIACCRGFANGEVQFFVDPRTINIKKYNALKYEADKKEALKARRIKAGETIFSKISATLNKIEAATEHLHIAHNAQKAGKKTQ